MLGDSGLPEAGAANCLPTALVARQAGQLIGCVALELYGPSALLRSLAVRQDWRGRGIGQELVRRSLDMARRHDVKTVYLLTETATAFFAEQFAFAPIDRAEVDLAVRQSVEFTTACPDSARAMILRL